MKTSTTKPTVTPFWPIQVPTNTYIGSPAAVYKVWFGKKYFIWKGKRLLQSAENLAESIDRYLRNNKNERENWLYFICDHIKKTGCDTATIEMVDSDFIVPGSVVALDAYRMLKVEQDLLKEADRSRSKNCLNNNEQAYIPKWMEKEYPGAVEKFLRNWDRK